jgi:hypothetical protein
MENMDAESIANLIKGGSTALSVALGSKPAALFIEKISGALGWYMEPKQIVRKARAEAEANLIKAESSEGNALEDRIITRIIYEESRFQQNIESIVLKTLANIKEDANPGDVEEDWFANVFEKFRRVSDEELQDLWSQILAGEVNRPGSFSARTINTISVLSKKEALAFKSICTFSWIDEENLPTLLVYADMINGRYSYPFSWIDLYSLIECGLIILSSSREYFSRSVGGREINFSYHGNLYLVQNLKNGEDLTAADGVPSGNLILTQAGRELARICEPTPNWQYMSDVISLLRNNGYTVIELKKE